MSCFFLAFSFFPSEFLQVPAYFFIFLDKSAFVHVPDTRHFSNVVRRSIFPRLSANPHSYSAGVFTLATVFIPLYPVVFFFGSFFP